MSNDGSVGAGVDAPERWKRRARLGARPSPDRSSTPRRVSRARAAARPVGVALSFLFLSSPAFALDAVVASGDCGKPNVVANVRTFRAALARQGVQTLSETDTQRRLGAASDSSVAEVDRLIASARFDYFDQGATERAERSLKATLEQLRTLPPSEARWNDVRDVRFMLGQIASRSGAPHVAREHFEAVFRVMPNAVLDQDRYSPALRTLAETVRADVKKRKTYPLTLTTTGESLPIYIDGKAMGTTPLTVKLPAGTYVVQASLADMRGINRELSLSGPDEVVFDPSHERLIQADAGPCLQTGTNRELLLRTAGRVGGQLAVQRIISVRLEEPSPGERYLVGTAIEAASGQELREGRVKVRDVERAPEVVDRLVSFLTTGRAQTPVEPVVGGTPVVGTEAGTGGSSVIDLTGRDERGATLSGRQAAGLATGGAGLVGLAGAGLLLLKAGDIDDERQKLCPGRTPHCEEGDDAEYQSLSNRHTAHLVGSAVIGGLGLVAVGVGSYLFFTPSDASTSLGYTPLPGGGGLLTLSHDWR